MKNDEPLSRRVQMRVPALRTAAKKTQRRMPQTMAPNEKRKNSDRETDYSFDYEESALHLPESLVAGQLAHRPRPHRFDKNKFQRNQMISDGLQLNEIAMNRRGERAEKKTALRSE